MTTFVKATNRNHNATKKVIFSWFSLTAAGQVVCRHQSYWRKDKSLMQNHSPTLVQSQQK